VAAYDDIPSEVVEAIAALNIYYGHTSHGSQLVAGVDHIDDYSLPNLHETSGDLGGSWNTKTDTYLASHPETDVVIWSWCGQQSSNSEGRVNTYLSNMNALEAEYPGVTFIYMTGHLRGAYSEYQYDIETNQVLQRNNKIITDYVAANNKWLFDFADIESYLDGSSTQCMYDEMPSECVWPDTPTFSCAHSRAPNCIRKGKAFLWLLARISGWDGN
jgi:hypothetical protein